MDCVPRATASSGMTSQGNGRIGGQTIDEAEFEASTRSGRKLFVAFCIPVASQGGRREALPYADDVLTKSRLASDHIRQARTAMPARGRARFGSEVKDASSVRDIATLGITA